jgi:endonuclease-3
LDKLEMLGKIRQMVKPLNPPVYAFESSARRTPFRVLISVLLSSRTKDPVTHQAAEQLFSAADTPKKMTELEENKIAELIFPVGFYKQNCGNSL